MEKDFGFVQDVCADLQTGKITSIIVPGNANFWIYLQGIMIL